MNVIRQKGCRDILPDDSKIWKYVENIICEVCKEYNIDEIRTPVFEATELFLRGVGDETDIVNKEMYTFIDKGDRSITLRPELTAGVVRAYIENGMSSKYQSPLKLWYTGNMYRYEKMQKGRYREFSQFGVEIFGSSSYIADLETILVSSEIFKRLEIFDKVKLSINSIGCEQCRQKYILALKDYVKPYLNDMCDTCKKRYDKNPLRMLDCKEDKCSKILKDVPVITDFLCDECKNDFENLKKALSYLSIPYVVDTKIVRGLDYYNKTVYEYVSKDLGLAVGGGGRYDKLVSVLGGIDTPAVGFGIGIDRIILLLKEYGLEKKIKKNVNLYFLTDSENTFLKSQNIIANLRELGYVVETNISNRSFNAQLKYANKINADFVVIFGENEDKINKCNIKNMIGGKQYNVDFNVASIIKVMKEGVD